MGYTYLWQRPRELAPALYKQLLVDTRSIIAGVNQCENIVVGPDGTGAAILNPHQIELNGNKECGHTSEVEVLIRWSYLDDVKEILRQCPDNWENVMSGAFRHCPASFPGSCKYENFILRRTLNLKYDQKSYEQVGQDLFLQSCRTGFRPYDLAVMAILIYFKKRFGDTVRVQSNVSEVQWTECQCFCSDVLGFDDEIEISDDGELLLNSSTSASY